MEDLLETLSREADEYEKLLSFSEERKRAVITANLPALETVTTKEQEVTDSLKVLEHRRLLVLKNMGEVMGKGHILTVTDTIKLLDKQPNEQKKLTEARDRLRSVADKVQFANMQCETLIRQALEMVEYDITLIKGMRQAPETANYGRNAESTGEILGRRGFDAKQ